MTDLNLDELVLFERNPDTQACSVEVYPLAASIPPVGEKLNKPAIISVRGCWPSGYTPRNHLSPEEEARAEALLEKYERKLKSTTKKAGAEFLQYQTAQGIWSFKVQSFS